MDPTHRESSHRALFLAACVLLGTAGIVGAEDPPPGPAASADPAKAEKVLKKGQDLIDEAVLVRIAGDRGVNEVAAALDFLERAVGKGFDGPEVQALLGRAYLMRNGGDGEDLVKAEAALTKGLAAPTAQGHFDLGEVHALAGRVAPAVESYKKALELDPEWAQCHLRLGKVYEGSGLPDAGSLAASHTQQAYSLDESLQPGAVDASDSGEADKIRNLVNEVMQKSESETLTDEQAQKYAEQIQNMLGEKK